MSQNKEIEEKYYELRKIYLQQKYIFKLYED